MHPQPYVRLHKNRCEAPCVNLPTHSSSCTPSNHSSETGICHSHARLPDLTCVPLTLCIVLFAILAFYINGIFQSVAFCNILFPNLFFFKFVHVDMAGFFVSGLNLFPVLQENYGKCQIHTGIDRGACWSPTCSLPRFLSHSPGFLPSVAFLSKSQIAYNSPLNISIFISES